MHIIHIPEQMRFETRQEGLACYIEYMWTAQKMNLIHTFVPQSLEGRGIASALVKFALEYAREKQLQIIPSCTYVEVWLRRHPEYRELL